MADVSLRCTCGALQGKALDVDPARGFRVVCHCDDCQAFAHYLEQSGVMLDDAGGTDIFQLTPAQLVLTAGAEHLACMRLTPRGLVRWFAKCCHTPVANTLPWASFPFAGVLQPFMDHAADGQTRDDVLGPVLARVQGRYAVGPRAAEIEARAPLWCLGRMIRNLLRGWVRGQQRPSPFFDPATGAPVAEPIVLTAEQRAELRQYCGPRPVS